MGSFQVLAERDGNLAQLSEATGHLRVGNLGADRVAGWQRVTSAVQAHAYRQQKVQAAERDDRENRPGNQSAVLPEFLGWWFGR